MLYMRMPAGQEEFFMAIGSPGGSRTAPAPKLSKEEKGSLHHEGGRACAQVPD